MWREFKKFAFRGNVIDLAVGVMIGGAFGKIVSSLVNDLFMPFISLLTGKMDVSALFVALDGKKYLTIADAQAAGSSTLNYGLFISTVIDFFLMAVCVFLLVKLLSKLHKKQEEPAPEKPVRICPYCRTQIDDLATRCPHCTSALPPEQA
ncbi:MAG: large conductance mechanosensitive channel protein MscL [Bacillota bacterium]